MTIKYLDLAHMNMKLLFSSMDQSNSKVMDLVLDLLTIPMGNSKIK